MGGWKQTLLPPIPPACRVAAGGLGRAAGRGCGGSPDAHWGPCGAGGAEGTQGAPTSQPSQGLAGHESPAVLLRSPHSALPWPQPRPSPRQRRQMPRQEVPPNPGSERHTRHSTTEGAGDTLHAPSPRYPTALVPLQRPPTRNHTFTRPETLQHHAAWAGGLPSPAGDNPAAGTIIS